MALCDSISLVPSPTIGEKQTSSRCDYKKIYRITCYALSIISLIVGILVLAKAGALSNVPRIWGGVMVAAAPVLALIPYLTERQYPCSLSRGQKAEACGANPIPTYDDLVASNAKLRASIQPTADATMRISFHFYGDGIDDHHQTANFANASLEDRRRWMHDLRQKYNNFANKRDFAFQVSVRFDQPGRLFADTPDNECQFAWGHRIPHLPLQNLST